MKNKKLKLEQLKVKSFVTEEGLNDGKTIKGAGLGQISGAACSMNCPNTSISTIDPGPYLTEDPYRCTVFACTQASACLPDGCNPIVIFNI